MAGRERNVAIVGSGLIGRRNERLASLAAHKAGQADQK